MREIKRFDSGGKATIVSGCPRSGTSLAMLCLKTALGEDSIIGAKFPGERRYSIGDQLEGETDQEYEARHYVWNAMNDVDVLKKEYEASVDMNPNGFWECRYTVQGLYWHHGLPNLNGKVIKVVSQGLLRSNPNLIERVIYMIREPHAIAKAHEKLRRMPFITAEQERDLKVHTPEMFINVTYQASLWLIQNPDIPIHFVYFDDLISKPDETLQGINQFIGNRGDFSGHPVNPKLKRSYPEDIEHHLWEYADKIYELFVQKKYEELVNYYEDNRVEITKEKIVTPCVRLRRRVAYNECIHCLTCHEDYVKNKISQAEAQQIDWRNEPCIFECATDPFGKHKSIKESIENNHWSSVLEEW